MYYNSGLMRLAMKKSLGVSFEKGTRDQYGNLILKKSKIVRYFPPVAFIIAVIGMVLAINSYTDDVDEMLAYLTFVGTAAIVLGIASIVLATSKTLISNDGVTSYRLFRKKHIYFSSIINVDYTSLFGGCAVLKSNDVKVLVPFDTIGFSEFVIVLKEKLGPEKCKGVSIELELRKSRLDKF